MALNMRTLKHHPIYTDWSRVTGTTVPGRAYSISELLMRTVRNQPLPIMNTYQEHDDGRNSDEDIDKDMLAASQHPFFGRDSDEIEAFEYLANIQHKKK